MTNILYLRIFNSLSFFIVGFRCACADAEQMVEHHRMIEKVEFDFVPPRPTKKAAQSKTKDAKAASTDKKTSSSGMPSHNAPPAATMQ